MATLASLEWLTLVASLLGQGCVPVCPLTSAICTLGENLACCPRTTLEMTWLCGFCRANSRVLVQQARHHHVPEDLFCTHSFCVVPPKNHFSFFCTTNSNNLPEFSHLCHHMCCSYSQAFPFPTHPHALRAQEISPPKMISHVVFPYPVGCQ